MKLIFDKAKQCFRVEEKEFSDLTFRLSLDSTLALETLEKLLKKMLEYVDKHKELKQLILKILRKGPINVHFLPHSQMSSSASYVRPSYWAQVLGFWQANINIMDSETDMHTLLDSFVFELINADNELVGKLMDDHLPELARLAELEPSYKIFLNAASTIADEHALKIETAEFHTDERCADLMLMGRDYGWPEPRGTQGFRVKVTLQDYLKNAKTPSIHYHGFSHFETYILDFHRNKIKRLGNAISAIKSKIAHICIELNDINYKRCLKESELKAAKSELEREKKLLLELQGLLVKKRALGESDIIREFVANSERDIKALEDKIAALEPKLGTLELEITEKIRIYEEHASELKTNIKQLEVEQEKMEAEIASSETEIVALEEKAKVELARLQKEQPEINRRMILGNNIHARIRDLVPFFLGPFANFKREQSLKPHKDHPGIVNRGIEIFDRLQGITSNFSDEEKALIETSKRLDDIEKDIKILQKQMEVLKQEILKQKPIAAPESASHGATTGANDPVPKLITHFDTIIQDEAGKKLRDWEPDDKGDKSGKEKSFLMKQDDLL